MSLLKYFKTESKTKSTASSSNNEIQSTSSTVASSTEGDFNTSGLAVPITTKGKRKFLAKWQDEFQWLQFDKETGEAKCTVCIQFKSLCDNTSRVVNGFQGPFRHETFKFHNLSQPHKRCVEALKLKENPEKKPLVRCMKKMDVKMFKYLEVLFNTAYYIALQNKPFTDFPDLLNLAQKLNVDVLGEYKTDKKCREFIHFIARDIKSELIKDILNSPFISILLDGSTDKATLEELILYVRYLKNNAVVESFLSIINLENATSAGYLEAIEKEFQNLGLDWKKLKLVGLGTDGAASMIGIANGLAPRMTREIDHLVSVHCLAHKLQLSVLSSMKEISYITEVDTVLISVYSFYQQSSKKIKQLSETATILSEKILKLQKVYKVRWVASKVGTIKAVLVDWISLITHLESIASESTSDESNKAKGILKNIKSFRFLMTLNFLMDFLTIFKNLSLILQKENLLLSQVTCHISSAIYSLEQLKSSRAKTENDFINSVSVIGEFKGVQLIGIDIGQSKFKMDREKIIEVGIKHLKNRFPDKKCTDVISSSSIFDTFTWPEKSLEGFGNEKLKTLSKHFNNIINNETEKLLDEWYEFKVVGRHCDIKELLKKSLKNKDRFPCLSELLAIIAVLPVSTASCERGFSRMNLIKNKFRTTLCSDSLNSLMMISLNGPSLQEYQPDKVIDQWYFSAQGVRHIDGHSCPKRKADSLLPEIKVKKHC